MKKTTIAILAVLVIALFAVAATAGGWMKGHFWNSEQYQAVQTAMDAGDYDAFVDAMGDHPWKAKKLNKINENNFETYVAMHNAKKEGDYETASALAEELGFEEGCAYSKWRK